MSRKWPVYKAALYFHVTSSEHNVENHSLSAQEQFFRELCKHREWEVAKIYREEGRTARYESIARRHVLCDSFWTLPVNFSLML